jgi:FG-GAP-like repeat
MNGDGIPDIVALGASSAYNAEIAIALGNGDGTFKAPILTDYAAQYLNNDQGIAVGDFDGDGKLDVLVTDYYDATGAGIFLGNGDGTLQTSGSGSNALPRLALNVTVGGVPVALNLSGTGRADAIAGNVELLSQAQTTTTTVPAGFSLSASNTSGSVAPGQSATSSVTVTPSGGLTGGVSFSCTGLPTGASCGFSPSSVTLGASAATSTLTISTTGQMAALTPGGKSEHRLPWAPGGIVLAALLIPLARIRRVNAQMRLLAWAAFLTIGAAALHGCGGNDNSGSSSGGGSGGGSGGTPAGTYTIVITATAGTTTHTVNYSLTVT